MAYEGTGGVDTLSVFASEGGGVFFPVLNIVTWSRVDFNFDAFDSVATPLFAAIIEHKQDGCPWPVHLACVRAPCVISDSILTACDIAVVE